VNCLTDFLLAFLPVPLVWQLRLNIRTRISLITILSLGIFAGVAGIIRATVFDTILKDPRRFVHDKWMMWNYVELNVGIIAGSLPALKPLFIRVLDAARERSIIGLIRTSKRGRPDTLEYHKQDQSNSGIALSEYAMGNRASNMAMDRLTWSANVVDSSAETALPPENSGDKAKGIFIKKEFHVA
jgi:hypothetical protein